MSFQCRGRNSDGEWELEIECDCYSLSEPFTAGVWITNTGAPQIGAFLSSREAREAAEALVKVADSVDENNMRVKMQEGR